MKMNLTAIKRAYRSVPYPFNAPLLHVPFEWFCGSAFRNQLKLLREQDACSPEQRQQLADQALIQYLKDAVQYTPFYSEFAKRAGIRTIETPDILFKFPIIDKETLIREGERLCDARYKNQRYLVSTGGTTGNQIHFYLSNDCYAKEWAFVAHFLSKHSISLNDRRLCLRGVEGIHQDSLIGYNPLYKEQLISPFRLNVARIKAVLNEIQKFNPRWIHGYPSSVADFANILKSIGAEIPSIKGVLLVSEKLHIDQKASISEMFGNNIATFYGLSERVIFAEKRDDTYYPNELYGATELIDGELVGTGFSNRATYLIRYRTGDAAQTSDSQSRLVRIDEITGRWNREFLVGHKGERISMTALNIHCDVLNGVRRYQFFQSTPGKCTLKLMIDENFDASLIPKITNLFQAKVGTSLSITTQIVSDIPLTNRGKHRYIISELSHNT